MTVEAVETEPGPLRGVVARSDLVRALTSAVAIAEPAPSRAGAAAGAHLRATDGALHVRCIGETSATLRAPLRDGEGQALVDARHLLHVTERLPSDATVRVEVDGKRLAVTAGAVLYRMPLLDLWQFPEAAPERDFQPWAQVDAETLAGLARVTSAASPYYDLPTLTGVLLDAPEGFLTAAATDRYRLTAYTSRVEATPDEVIIVARSLARAVGAMKGSGAGLATRSDALRLTSDAATVDFARITGRFPTWRDLVPDDHVTRVDVDRQVLITAIVQAEVVVSASRPVRMAVHSGGLTVTGGEEKDDAEPYASVGVEAMVVGQYLDIAANPTYLRQALQAHTGGAVRLRIPGPHRPMVIQAVDGDGAVTALVMPVRTES